MPTSKLQRLAEVYNAQLTLYQFVLAMAEQQANCVENGNMTDFAEVLRRRDTLTGDIDALAEEVGELGRELGKQLGLPEVNLTALRLSLPEEQVEPVANVLSELASVIMKIQTVDERTAIVLQDIIRGMKGHVPEAKRSQGAMKAYKQMQQAKSVDKHK